MNLLKKCVNFEVRTVKVNIKTIIGLLFISVFSSIFAMSIDGEQQPVKHIYTSRDTLKGHITTFTDPIPMDKWKTTALAIGNEEGFYASSIIKLNDQPDSLFLKKHYETYKKKFFDLGLTTIEYIPNLYYHKINLNAIKELKKIGIDLYKLDKNHFNRIGPNERIIECQVVFTGEIVDTTYDSNEKAMFHSIYSVKVDSIIKGSEFYDKIPEYIKIYGFEGPGGLKFRGPSFKYEIGNKISQGFTKIYYEHYVDNTFYKLDENRILSDSYEYFSIDLLNSFNFSISGAKFDSTFVKEFEKVNDTKNFYKKEF